ncbi:MAG TPA: ABC transporter permease [Pseudonocardiaceae bacterium]|jgi:ABC-2 type transport system permease protein|nr:ABC transporter permease [Pseudonocardiaceae bacterium]
MTAIAIDPGVRIKRDERGGLRRVLRDGGIVTWRNLLNVRRNPEMLMGATVQPIMFVLLFAYVFGGSLGGSGYREFLMAGIFTQTTAFNSAFTTIGMANDLQKGIIDRFRSLPMSRVAVILGRTTSDLLVSALGLVVMSLCGLIVGWRIHGGVLDAVAAYGLLLLFAFAMSWTGALVGLAAGSVEVAQSAGFIWMFPVTFISSAFVSATNLPGPLRAFAEWNPITTVADACRKLFGNHNPPNLPAGVGWAADHALLYSVGASILIIAVFLPLAVSRYRRVASH